MDRGRDRDDGLDDIEAAPDHTIEPTVGAGEGPVPEGAWGQPDPDRAVDTSEPVGSSTDAGVPAAAVGDERPTAWLADIRARAPWLLDAGGALAWRAADVRRPDSVPHGGPAPEPFSPLDERGESRDSAEPGAPAGFSFRGGDGPPDDQIIAGDAGPPASAGGPGRGQVDVSWPAAVLHPPGPPPRETAEAGAGASAGAVGAHDRADAGVEGPGPRADRPPPGPVAGPRPPAAEPLWPDALRPEDFVTPPPARRPPLDTHRPAIHRSSATWPAPPVHPASTTPVWPPRPHPDGAALPRHGPIAEPNRPLHRPVTPFVPDRPLPASPPTQPPRPTWAEDRTGWHPTAVPIVRVVDTQTLPPWPSLLDDDGDDDDADEPDWPALERGFDRMLRLDREQRRR